MGCTSTRKVFRWFYNWAVVEDLWWNQDIYSSRSWLLLIQRWESWHIFSRGHFIYASIQSSSLRWRRCNQRKPMVQPNNSEEIRRVLGLTLIKHKLRKFRIIKFQKTLRKNGSIQSRWETRPWWCPRKRPLARRRRCSQYLGYLIGVCLSWIVRVKTAFNEIWM